MAFSAEGARSGEVLLRRSRLYRIEHGSIAPHLDGAALPAIARGSSGEVRASDGGVNMHCAGLPQTESRPRRAVAHAKSVARREFPLVVRQEMARLGWHVWGYVATFNSPGLVGVRGEDLSMIFGKFFSAIRAQFNKLANFFWEADPIAQMQYEYDSAVEQLKEGRLGLEQYRALVERVSRQVKDGENQVAKLTAQAKAYLKAGDRETAGSIALQLTKARAQLDENRQQLVLHETAYGNNLKKIQHANKKLVEVKDKIQKYDADLKMSSAEAEVAQLSQSLNFDVTTDFGQLEDVIQRKIDANRGKVRVAADLSAEGLGRIEAEERMEQSMADDALKDLEVELGMRAPETTPVAAQTKDLGPAEEAVERRQSEKQTEKA
jgi:phage shock protein A